MGDIDVCCVASLDPIDWTDSAFVENHNILLHIKCSCGLHCFTEDRPHFMCIGANPVRNLTAVKEMEKRQKNVKKKIWA